MSEKNFRTESDLLGERKIPANAYYGVQTDRAIENFKISGNLLSQYHNFIKGMAITKKAAAIANEITGMITSEQRDAIVWACDELIAGKYHEQFPIDMIQGGAGTSTNMAANEVIANLALERMVYVPICHTHEGRLKARNPYVYGELAGKYGLWCGPDDYVCGSTQIPWNLSGHTKYVDKIPQLTAILRKRLAHGSDVSARSVSLKSASTDDESNVFAEFTLNSYYGNPGDTITIDASPSFSLDADIVSYEWSIDGEEFWSSGLEPRISVSYDEKSNHTIRVRVTDFLYESGEAEAEID
ncbi:MAG: hypothetical protein II532_02450, partial [Bacteroidales bacterium]|nr:hypothetical protein [Bacteroidales bacterium]